MIFVQDKTMMDRWGLQGLGSFEQERLAKKEHGHPYALPASVREQKETIPEVSK